MNLNLDLMSEEEWSGWTPVHPVDEQGILHRGPGILRVSHTKVSGIHFVGHSKKNIQARIRDLGYQLGMNEMPHTSPFSAAPSLWAMNQELDGEFYVSFLKTSDGESAETLEDVYLTAYRIVTSQSPTANYGRMYSDYSKSSSNEKGIRGKKADGRHISKPIGSHRITVGNVIDVTSDGWIGFDWEDPIEYYPDRLQGLSPSFPNERGLFRIWKEGQSTLESVGLARVLDEEIAEAIPDKKEDWMVSYCTMGFSSQSEVKEIESILQGSHYIATEATTDVWENIETQVRSIIELGESEETEFKREIPSNAKDIVKEILSIGNTRGGQLLLGVTNEGDIVGLPDLQSTKGRVSDLIRGNTKKRPPVNYESVSINGDDILIVFIDKATEHPYAYKKGIFYLRDGPQRIRMAGEDLHKWFSERD